MPYYWENFAKTYTTTKDREKLAYFWNKKINTEYEVVKLIRENKAEDLILSHLPYHDFENTKEHSHDVDDKEVMVYFDMDGVLANWNKFATADTVYSSGYFSVLEPNKHAIALINCLIDEDIKVGVLSKANLSGAQNAVMEKIDWLKNYIPRLPLRDNIIFVPLTQDKSDFEPLMSKNKIIIDDYNPNLYDMQRNLDNCICLKALNGINSQNVEFSSIYLTGENSITLEQNINTIKEQINELLKQEEMEL